MPRNSVFLPNKMNEPVRALVENAFLVVGAAFPIVDPLGNTPGFLIGRTLTGHLRSSEK